MRTTASKRTKWQSTTLFAAMLAISVATIATTSSGCGPNDVVIHDCPDAGMEDGGSGGQGGSGGSNCK